jgi:hypothetical protein
MRFEMEFDEFKREYMVNLNGYLPTYIGADEEFTKRGFIRINVEMIAPSRMMDGPNRFFRVIRIEIDEKQYEEIKMYAAKAGDTWKNHLLEKVENCLEYSQSKF